MGSCWSVRGGGQGGGSRGLWQTSDAMKLSKQVRGSRPERSGWCYRACGTEGLGATAFPEGGESKTPASGSTGMGERRGQHRRGEEERRGEFKAAAGAFVEPNPSLPRQLQAMISSAPSTQGSPSVLQTPASPRSLLAHAPRRQQTTNAKSLFLLLSKAGSPSRLPSPTGLSPHHPALGPPTSPSGGAVAGSSSAQTHREQRGALPPSSALVMGCRGKKIRHAGLATRGTALREGDQVAAGSVAMQGSAL